MRRLLPEPPSPEVDPFEAYGDQPPDWLRLDFVLSLDGSVTDEQGRSGGLGGDADLRVFRTQRALADAVLVGAGTARVEGFGPYRPTGEFLAHRRAAGKPDHAPIVVVSRSLRVPPALLEAPDTLVVTSAEAASTASPAVRSRLLVAGGTEVDLTAALARLRSEHGLRQLVCEGGPGLAGHLLAARLVDEVCLSLAPTLVGTGQTPLVTGLPRRTELTLTALYEQDGVLFGRYRPA